MSKINGHGGFWVVATEAPLVRIDNSEYELEGEAIIDDVTDSGSGGVAEGLPCLFKLNSLTMTVPEDDSFYLTALGLGEGDVATIYLRRGEAAQWDLATGVIIRSVRHANPQDKARRITITGEYGRLQRNVAGPAGFE